MIDSLTHLERTGEEISMSREVFLGLPGVLRGALWSDVVLLDFYFEDSHRLTVSEREIQIFYVFFNKINIHPLVCTAPNNSS